jgi:zinc transport system substrate-binding protein
MNAHHRLLAGCFLLVAMAAMAPAAPQRVVATTTWTAALALAAGARDIVTLAPSSLRHPAEYELVPSDVARLSGATLIISTGFEVMASRLSEAAGSRKIPVLRVDADYSLATIRASLLAIGSALGTTDAALRSIGEIADYFSSWRAELAAAGLQGAPVVTHVFQKPLLVELGFTVAGMFGPAPLEAAQIAKLSPVPASLLVDNWHNEVASPLRETMSGARFVSLINFPGPEGTVTLLDVLKDNHARLSAAMVPKRPGA